MENLVYVLVVIMSISIVIQIVVLVAAFVQVRSISFNIKRFSRSFEENTIPVLMEIKEASGQIRELLHTLHATAENFQTVSESVKAQVETVNAAIEDASTRARNQIVKIDGVISDAVLRLEATSLIIQQSVLTPIREVSALIRGISGGLQFLFSSKKNPVNQAHQDEELFI